HAHAATEAAGGHGTPDPATRSGGRTAGASAPDSAGSKRARAGVRLSQRACQGDGAQRSGLCAPPRGVGEIARQPVGRGAREAGAGTWRCKPKLVRRTAMSDLKAEIDMWGTVIDIAVGPRAPDSDEPKPNA